MKKNFLKIIALSMALILGALALASCAKGDEGTTDSSQVNEEATQPIPSEGGDVNDALVVDNDKLIELFKDGKCEFSVVRGDLATEGEKNTASEIQRKIRMLTDISVSITDDYEYSADKYEIVVGSTQYPETDIALKQWKYNEYGVCVVGNKVIVAGHNVTATKKAGTLFTQLLEKSVVRENDTVTISFKGSDAKLGVVKSWLGDIPAFEGGEYASCYDIENENLLINYKKTNEGMFDAYVEKLKSNGYTVKNERAVSGNKYVTMLSDKGMIYVAYYGYDELVSIITDSQKKTELFEDDVTEYTKVSDTTLGIISLDYGHRQRDDGNGMSYVITLEDGRFVIMDGGYAQDSARLYDYLVANNKRTDGKIIVAAWFLSHSHADHYGCIQSFAPAYGDKVEVQNMIANATNEEYFKSGNTPFITDTLPGLIKNFEGDTKLIKPHTGQIFTICGVDFEVMFTHENLYANVKFISDENDTSTVIRMKADGKTVLFTADAATADACTEMVKMHGEELKSDILQVNHHGYSGGSKNFFKAVDPSYAMWTTSFDAFALRRYKTWSHGCENWYVLELVGCNYDDPNDWTNICIADGTCKLLPMNFENWGDWTEYTHKIPETSDSN